MKNISQPFCKALIGWGCILLLSFCNPPSNQSEVRSPASQVEVPALLDKNADIGNPIEQQTILTNYNNLKKAIKKNPKDAEARLRLAQLLMQEARLTGEHGYYYPAALRTIEEVLAEKNLSGDHKFLALSLKATVYLSLHQFENALETGKQALQLNDHFAYLYGVLTDAHVELGNYQEAVRMSDKMVAIRPDLRSYSRISYLREIHGDVKGAIEAMQLAIDAGYPSYEETAWCRVTLGKLYETHGDLQKAEMQYQLALENRPDYPFALAALADLDMKKEAYAAAEEKLHKACQIIPEVSFYEQLVVLYQKTGKEEKANQLLQEVFAMMEDDEKHGHNMALSYALIHLHMSHDYDKALQYAMKEYKDRPANIDVNKVLTEIYLRQKNFVKAKEHMAKALITNTSDPVFLSVVRDVKKGES